MQIQDPIRRLNHLASFHKSSHCYPLVEVLLLISQEQHRKTFPGASARNTNVRASPVRVFGTSVGAKTLNDFVAD